jgi:hypothetical protein
VPHTAIVYSLPSRTPALGLIVVLLLCAGVAQAGPPFITDDPEPVDYQHWEVYGFTAGVNEHGNSSGWLPGVEVNYGAAPELQLHLIASFAFDAPDGAARSSGVGDTELGAKYRLVNPGKEDWWPQIGVFPLLELPTGNAPRGLGAGYTQAFLPVWLQKDFGDWTTYGGGGYWINPGTGNRNFWYTGWLLQRKITETFVLGGEIFHQTSSGTGRNGTFGFNLGGIYDFTEHYHLLFSAGRGGLLYAVDASSITGSDKPFAYYLGFQWTS